MSEDEEIEAMKKIAGALEPLNDAARNRALQWALSRFRGASLLEKVVATNDQPISDGNTSTSDGRPPFETFAELFEAASPGTEREKALLASYWVQVCQNQPTFGSQTLNDELKDLGHGVGNITEALTALKNERPALVLQLKKSGTSRQARKTYKLTQEGTRRVQAMVRSGVSVEESH